MQKTFTILYTMKIIRTIKYHVTEFFRKKTQLEHLQKYAEKVILSKEVAIMPDNILVHNFGHFGFAGRHGIKNGITQFKSSDGNTYNFPIPIEGGKYIGVPEITGWWTFRAWLHEAGHSAKIHCDKRIPTYIKEYEAEKFCFEKAKKCKHVDKYTMELIKESGYNYLLSHMEKHARETDCDRIYNFKKEVIDFLPKLEREYLSTSLDSIRIAKYAKEVDARMARVESLKSMSGGMFYGG